MLLLCVSLGSSLRKTEAKFFLASMPKTTEPQRLHLDTCGRSSAKRCERRTLPFTLAQEYNR